jgi:endonuclease/exonuclease/phosphatase family metal-dependent hydrolase
MSVSLKLIQLNIEGNKHLDLVLPFLQEENPDVICLQELCDGDISRFETVLGGSCHYTPMSRGTDDLIRGIGIISRVPIIQLFTERYGGSNEALPNFNETDVQTIHDSQRLSLIICAVEKEGQTFRIGTTHLSVTEKGQTTDFQREDMTVLLRMLEKQVDLVFAGDFNAPRGGEIFSMLSEHYTDNVPAHYISSIDGTLHRAGPLPFMVDGIFSTPEYRVSDVSMRGGVSDHCALIATVTKVEV